MVVPKASPQRRRKAPYLLRRARVALQLHNRNTRRLILADAKKFAEKKGWVDPRWSEAKKQRFYSVVAGRLFAPPRLMVDGPRLGISQPNLRRGSIFQEFYAFEQVNARKLKGNDGKN